MFLISACNNYMFIQIYYHNKLIDKGGFTLRFVLPCLDVIG